MEATKKRKLGWSNGFVSAAVIALTLISAMRLAGLLAGLVAMAIVGAIMASLEGRPRAKRIIGWSLLVVLLVVGTAATGWRPVAPTKPAVTVVDPYMPSSRPTPPTGFSYDTPENTVTQGSNASDWNTVASTFEASHPELKYGSNYQIMQGYVSRFDDHRMSSEALLDKAYAASAIDPSWSVKSADGIVWDKQNPSK